MTTNQTIDGVTRDLLQSLYTDTVKQWGLGGNAASQLRALLDSTDLKCSVPAIDTSALGIKPASQPQGEPVAPFYICDVDFNRLVRDDTAIASVRVSREKRGPFTEPLYAEQPAPVAVVLPERKHVPDFTQHPLLNKEYTGWNACLEEVTRLNTK